MKTPFSVIKNMFWDDYGYTLPDDPSYLATKVIEELDYHGYRIESYILDDNPKNMFGRESKEINGTT